LQLRGCRLLTNKFGTTIPRRALISFPFRRGSTSRRIHITPERVSKYSSEYLANIRGSMRAEASRNFSFPRALIPLLCTCWPVQEEDHEHPARSDNHPNNRILCRKPGAVDAGRSYWRLWFFQQVSSSVSAWSISIAFADCCSFQRELYHDAQNSAFL
jgi:hypothetical protein